MTVVPDQGQANAAVIALLAKIWKIPKSSFTLVHGLTQRRKVVELSRDSGVLLKKLQQKFERDKS